MALTEALAQMKKQLEKNGFPTQTVSFPQAQLASYCHKQDISLSSLLGTLEDEGINHTFVDERIHFSAAAKARGPRDPMTIMQDIAKDLDLGKLQEIIGKNPDKKPSFMDMVKALGPKKLKDLAKKIATLSPEERESVMSMAKAMGFDPPVGK